MKTNLSTSALLVCLLHLVACATNAPSTNAMVAETEIAALQAKQHAQCKRDARQASDTNGERLCDCVLAKIKISVPKTQWEEAVRFTRAGKDTDALLLLMPKMIEETRSCVSMRG